MNNPLVSVIIPVYNVELYIRKCVESVLLQDYKNIEIIVVNDGSPDDSIKNIQDIADSRLKIFDRINSGVSDSRNFGLKQAQGDYIYFLDSDDWIESNLIKTCVNEILEKQSDIVYFNFFIDTYSKNGELIKTEKSQLKDIIEKDDAILNLVGYSWNKLYKKSFIEAHELFFKKDLKIHEDIDFNLRCFSKSNDISFINSTFYHYNNRLVESLVKSYNPDNIKYFNTVLKTLLDYLLQKNYDDQLRLQIASAYIMSSLRHQFNAVFQFTDFGFSKRTKVFKTILNEFENLEYLKYYRESNSKDLIVKNLSLYKFPLILNIILSLKK